jgi:chemotaxis protein MotB
MGDFRVLSESIVDALIKPRAGPPAVAVELPAPSEDSANAAPEQPLIFPLPMAIERGAEGTGSANLNPELARDGPRGNELRRIAESFEERMGTLVNAGYAAVKRERERVEVEIRSSLLFPAGSRVLLADATALLDDFGDVLLDIPNDVSIEGHTDNRLIRNGRFTSNWELSSARAAALVEEFVARGVAPGRLSATGYGEYRPMADNDTEAGRNVNQRMVLAIRFPVTSETPETPETEEG